MNWLVLPVRLAIAVGGILIVNTAATAQETIRWKGGPTGANGIYDFPTHWFGSVRPAPEDTAQFGLLGDYIVDFRFDATNAQINVQDGNVTFRGRQTYNVPFAQVRFNSGLVLDRNFVLAGDSIHVRDSNLTLQRDSRASYERMSLFGDHQVLVQNGTLDLEQFSGDFYDFRNPEAAVTTIRGNSGSLTISDFLIRPGLTRVNDGGTLDVNEILDSGGVIEVSGVDSNLEANFFRSSDSPPSTIGTEIRVIDGGSATIDQSIGVGRFVVEGDGSEINTGSQVVFGGRVDFTVPRVEIRDGGRFDYGNVDADLDSLEIAGETSQLVTRDNSLELSQRESLITDAASLEVQNLTVREGAFTDSGTFRLHGLTVSGTGSTVTANGQLQIQQFSPVVGASSSSVKIEDGGTLSSATAIVGGERSSDDPDSRTGTVFLQGAGSRWEVDGALEAGETGVGVIAVSDGGVAEVGSARLAGRSGGRSSLDVRGSGARFETIGDMQIGVDGEATATIGTGGSVAVGGTLEINDRSSAVLDGGELSFESTSFDNLPRISGASGRVAGNIDHGGYSDLATVGRLGSETLDTSGLSIRNQGTLYGNASFGASLENQTVGEIQAIDGERLRFAGTGTNGGEINLLGGQIRFEGTLSNQADGFIGGQGTLIANGGLQNAGVIALTGDSNILGDLELQAGSHLVTTGFAVTTLFDDVAFSNATSNQAEIRTSEGSATVILGSISGNMNFTGTGDVFAEGDLRPGNSPGIGVFEGDLALGNAAMITIELAGEKLGEFDQLLIDGNFSVDGLLQVDLTDGFTLADGQQFLVADVEGSMAGQFSGLGEGSLVGSYAGKDLFITYQGFAGNRGVGLFTTIAIPEPGSGIVLAALGLCLSWRRYRSSPEELALGEDKGGGKSTG